MTNRWITKDEPLVTWVAELSSRRDQPELLWLWLRGVLEAGEQQQVYAVQESPTVRYRSERDGPFISFLERRFQQSGDVDLFHFASSRMRRIGSSRFRTVARVAYYTADGRLIEDDLDDLGALLRRLRPHDLKFAPAFMKHGEPLVIGGPIVNVLRPTRSVFLHRTNPVRIDFALFSDIWFPWVAGLLEDAYDIDKMYDNRALCQRHTPRLNRFLATVHEHTLALGGSWQLEPALSDPELGFMLLPDGIHLDVELPRGVTEWPDSSDTEAIPHC